MSDSHIGTRFLDFLVAYNHDLRTPLNSVIGFSRVILKGIDGPINDIQAEDLKSIHDGGLSLLAMLNEVIDMAKLERGRLELTPRRLDNLTEIFEDTVSKVEPLIEGKPVTFQTDLPADLPSPWADDTRIRQIIHNLVSFCARNTPAGVISLRAATLDDAMLITVEDTGNGWSPEETAALLKPYRPPAEVHHIGGTGLSLAIACRLAELQGGSLAVESQIGRGTRFSLMLPLHAPPGAEVSGENEAR